MMKSCVLASVLLLLPASVALADVDVAYTVDKGSEVTCTVAITVNSIFGTQTDTDTITVGADGFANGSLAPSSEPFTDVNIEQIEFEVDDGTLNYQFFCVPIFGCQNLAVHVTNLSLILDAPTSATLDASNFGSFDSVWRMTLDYQISGDLFNLTGDAEEVEAAGFGCRFSFDEGSSHVYDMELAPIPGTIDPAKLPTGIYEVTLLTTVAMGAASMTGTYEPASVPGDLNGDDHVDGADLGLLLSQFGVAGSADFDGNGVVNGGDLGLLLSFWTG